MYDVVPAMYEDDKKHCARIDLKKANQVADVELGSEVEIVIKGKVKSMRGPEDGTRESYKGDGKSKMEKYHYPGTLELEISSMKIVGVGEFDGLDE